MTEVTSISRILERKTYNVLSPLEFRWGFSLSFFLKYILITTEILWKRGEEKLNTVKILFQRRKLL